MKHPVIPRRIALVLLPLTLAGCGFSQSNDQNSTSSPQGPSIFSSPADPPTRAVTSTTTTPSNSASTASNNSTHNESPPERDGTIPTVVKRAQTTVSASVVSGTPQRALERFAQLYTNWNASTVRAHQLALAAISVGAARLTSEQAAAHVQGDAAIGQDSVSNSGEVVSIARGMGSAQGFWVIVTREQLDGRSAYRKLPSQLHVTYAQVTAAGGGWVVSSWQPQN
jgi:hypothetical protein